MSKLNQIIAVEKSVKSEAHKSASTVYKQVQKPALFDGFVKNWRPSEDSGEERPPESKRVQIRAQEALDLLRESFSELIDITAQKDYANCGATADVVVAGRTIVAGAPVTYLLFLEKYLIDIRAFLSHLPVLSEDEKWELREATGLYESEPLTTQSTKKVQKPIVLYDATERHPAQTQLVSQDVIVGHWETIKQSGAMSRDQKKLYLTRVDTLLKAVKFAREEANAVDAPKINVSDEVFNYLLG